MRIARVVVGLALVAFGVWLVSSPSLVAEWLSRPHETVSERINLRASWGGTVLGLGAFVAWLPALAPWPRTAIGLLLWAMAGIGAARAVGFVLDGRPDGLQWVWLIAEVVLVVVAAVALVIMARRAAARRAGVESNG